MGTGQPPSIAYPKDVAARKAIIARNDEYVKRHIYALEDRQAKLLKRELERARDEMSGKLVNAAMQHGGEWSALDPNFRNRTEALMQQITVELDRLLQDAQNSTLNAMEQGYRAGYYGRAWVIDDALRGGGVVNLPMLPTQAVRSALISPYGGMTFIDRFADARLDFVKRIRRGIVQSQIQGDSIPAAIKRLSDELGINVTRTGAERGLRARLEMIARTEILRSSNLGSMAVYEANRDVLRGWEFEATLDERTCNICGPRDGKQYPFDSQAEKPPLHPHCRCAVTPVLIDEAMERGIVGKHQTWAEWKASRGIYDTGAMN
jgi:SPP1 gp7 family putative phage head morphogenesis protein